MAHPVDIHVGQRLRQRRTKIGMSQEALAKNSGITFQQVQKYERGANRLSASRIYEFAMVLGVSAGYFFENMQSLGLAQLAEDKTPFAHELVPKADQEFFKAYQAISDDKAKQHIKALVMAISKGDAAL